MRITGPIAPTNPFQIARAYGVNQPAAPRMQGAAPVHQTDTLSTRAPLAASRLVAAVVPGKVDFDAPQTAGTVGGAGGAGVDRTMQLYRHPADRNIAATGVTLGRAIDVSG